MLKKLSLWDAGIFMHLVIFVPPIAAWDFCLLLARQWLNGGVMLFLLVIFCRLIHLCRQELQRKESYRLNYEKLEVMSNPVD
jgi:hypothetical protein